MEINRGKCRIEGCEEPQKVKHLCRKHYAAEYSKTRKRKPCAFGGCRNLVNGSTWCMAHENQLRAGKPLAPLQKRPKVIDGKKLCPHCDRTLPVEMFHRQRHRCKDCAAIASRMRLYKLSRDEVIAMAERPCDTCGAEVSGKQQHFDHDHATGKVRGVLCDDCNHILGRAKDNPALLRALAAYLERQQ